MTASIAINGFGRIGRMVFRQAIAQEDLNVVAINARYPLETLAHLIKYDSTHGTFTGEIALEENALIVNGQRVQIVNDRDPANLPWKELNVDIVIESTGKFNDGEKAKAHMKLELKRLLLQHLVKMKMQRLLWVLMMID